MSAAKMRQAAAGGQQPAAASADPTTVPVAPVLAGFGLQCCSLHIDPEASTLPDALLFDALCLAQNALAVFDQIADGGQDLPETMFAGLWLLRHAVAVIDAAQTPRARAIAAGAKPLPGAAP